MLLEQYTIFAWFLVFFMVSPFCTEIIILFYYQGPISIMLKRTPNRSQAGKAVDPSGKGQLWGVGFSTQESHILGYDISSHIVGLPWWLSGKECTCDAEAAEDMGSIPGSGRSPRGRHGNPFQYSCLKKSMDRGTWQTTVHRAAKSWTRPKQLSRHTLWVHVIVIQLRRYMC